MPTVLPDHPPWRRLLVAWVSLPALVVLAVLAFAWPAARVAPRELPVGIVGAGTAAQSAVGGLAAADPGAFDLHLFADRSAARAAIVTREVTGAFLITPRAITVLTASAAGPALAQVLDHAGAELGAAAHRPVTSIDIVALSADDPRGTVFASALLPITICGVIVSAGLAVLFRFRPAWRQLIALAGTAVVAALGVYLVVQGFLGALPHQPLATWAALALAVFAIGAATSGLLALLGPAGLAVAALTMVFLGNPSSGVTSAPELLPPAVADVGRWLPPGAAAGLLRSTAYFGGNGGGGYVTVLVVWALLGTAAISLGHRRAARADKLRDGIGDAVRYVDGSASVVS